MCKSSFSFKWSKESESGASYLKGQWLVLVRAQAYKWGNFFHNGNAICKINLNIPIWISICHKSMCKIIFIFTIWKLSKKFTPKRGTNSSKRWAVSFFSHICMYYMNTLRHLFNRSKRFGISKTEKSEGQFLLCCIYNNTDCCDLFLKIFGKYLLDICQFFMDGWKNIS